MTYIQDVHYYIVLYLGHTVPIPIADHPSRATNHYGGHIYRVFILYQLPITHLGVPITTAVTVELYLHRHPYTNEAKEKVMPGRAQAVV
jgi:hypothetical protein